jgi:4-diphosphocytidyl-2-C-methyl-D-erythritol kinase
MISFPHAKINLGLIIQAKRPDGFHNLETIFYPLPIRDVLEIIPSNSTRLITSGLDLAGDPEENLVLRAFRLLKSDYPSIPTLDIYLHKAIPMAAGLGGGSSDAAEILKMVNRFFDLNIPPARLYNYALSLGSDCPFFMQPAPCFATGRGEILEPLPLDLSAFSFLLVHPKISIGTAWAYSKIQLSGSENDLKTSILEPIQNWKKTIQNVFEGPVFAAHPSLQKIKTRLYDAGALYASMTGSGSTIFGIFEKENLPEILFDNAITTHIR